MMSESRHKWLTEYFDKRPQLARPNELMFGYDIPVEWKNAVEKLLSDRDALEGKLRE